MATESGTNLPKVGKDDEWGSWAIVYSGVRIFIGDVAAADVGEDEGEMPAWVVLDPVYEVTTQLIPTGHGPNGQMIVNKVISAEPVLLSFAGSSIELAVTSIMRFGAMQASDLNRYKKLVADAERVARNARASDAGLALPGN